MAVSIRLKCLSAAGAGPAIGRRIAAMKFIKPDFRITQEHGKWFDVNGRRVMALYHPAALLRDPNKRPETFDDLKRLQAEIRSTCVRTY